MKWRALTCFVIFEFVALVACYKQCFLLAFIMALLGGLCLGEWDYWRKRIWL